MFRNEIVSKINDTKEEITAEEYAVMREYLKMEFSDDYIDESADDDILILFLKQSIEDITKDSEYYYFGSVCDTDLYLCAKALYKIINN